MSVIEKSIEVDAPVRLTYDQWTQFEDFPEFMDGVEAVEQLDDTTLRWETSIGGVKRSFDARITQQEPDRRIAWETLEGEDQSGVVTFEPAEGLATRVTLEMTYDSDRWTDKVADFLNVIEKKVEGDLERFKNFIEERHGAPTGAWRGRVEDGSAEQQ